MRSSTPKLSLASTVLLLPLAGCSLGWLVGTQIEIQGAQTSLEQQVLGSFDRLGEEVYLLAGVRAVDPVTGAAEAPPPMTRSEAGALAARRRMEFNRDDILRFKRQGDVGEANNGLLVAFDEQVDALQQSDPRAADLVEALVSEENEDRSVIMRRLVDTNPALGGDEGPAAIGRILASKYRREAEAGMRVQLPDGTWTTAQGGG